MAYFYKEPSRTFGEYLLIPGYSSAENIPTAVSLKTPLVKYRKGEENCPLEMNIPMISAIMQSVSGDKLAIALAMILLAGAAMLGFLGTRLGLSIRATGDNAAMVRASSINPAFTITVGLCISGALCALSGGLLAQYQKSCDINVGTGMVTIALASLIIGETLLGKRTMPRRIIGVVFGSCLYRFIVAVALRFNVPAAAMKLVSAIIVAIAISMPAIKEKIAFEQRKHGACRRRVTTGKEGK